MADNESCPDVTENRICFAVHRKALSNECLVNFFRVEFQLLSEFESY